MLLYTIMSYKNKNEVYTKFYNENFPQLAEFEKERVKELTKFIVQIESRYLVTPAFMERFLNMTTAFGTNKAKCAFCGEQIIFAITSGKDLFEPGSLFKPLTDIKNIGFINELMSILEMIDYFKLDQHTGL